MPNLGVLKCVDCGDVVPRASNRQLRCVKCGRNKRKEYVRKCREANPGAKKESDRKYRESHRENIKEYNRKWGAANAELKAERYREWSGRTLDAKKFFQALAMTSTLSETELNKGEE